MNSKDIHALNEAYKARGEVLNEEMHDCLRDGLSYAECCRMYPDECREDRYGKTGKVGIEEEPGEVDFLRDVLGYEPEDFGEEDPDQAAMDRNDRETGDAAFNSIVEYLQKFPGLKFAAFDESQQIQIGDTLVKVVGHAPGDQ